MSVLSSHIYRCCLSQVYNHPIDVVCLSFESTILLKLLAISPQIRSMRLSVLSSQLYHFWQPTPSRGPTQRRPQRGRAGCTELSTLALRLLHLELGPHDLDAVVHCGLRQSCQDLQCVPANFSVRARLYPEFPRRSLLAALAMAVLQRPMPPTAAHRQASPVNYAT